MQDNKFDAGPLQTLKAGLNLEELKKNISIDSIHIKTLIKIIKNGRQMQRFAVCWGADENNKASIVLGATLPFTATSKDIQELIDVCGHAIVAEKDLRGIVHQKLKKQFPVPGPYKGGLSFYLYIGEHHLGLMASDRSTDQYELQDYNGIAAMSHFYNFFCGPDKTKTICEKKENQFTQREFNENFNQERTSMRPITELIFDTIHKALWEHIKDSKEIQINKITINYAGCHALEYHQTWEKEFRYNKDKIADFLLTTICVACGYNDDRKAGEFWPKLPDDKIVFKAVKVAEDANIPLDLNKIPNQLKQVFDQDDFSITALMFAAKKTDIDEMSRLKLVLFLIQKGADPAVKDKNGCNALWYAQQKNNVSIAEHLSTLLYSWSTPLEKEIDVKESKINYQNILSLKSSVKRQPLLIEYVISIYEKNLFSLSDHEKKQTVSLAQAKEIIFSYLKKLAQDKKWETQGKGIVFFHVPRGVSFITSDECKSYQQAIEKIEQRFRRKGFFEKSDLTYSLYELIMAIDEFAKRKNSDGFLKNYTAFSNTIQNVFSIFCETWSLTPIKFDSADQVKATAFDR